MNEDSIFDQLCLAMAPICRPYVKEVLELDNRNDPITKDDMHAFVNGLMACEEFGDELQEEAAIVHAAIEAEDFSVISEDFIDDEALLLARQLISHWTISIQLALRGKTEIELDADFYPKNRDPEEHEELDVIATRSSLTQDKIRNIMKAFLGTQESLRIQEGIEVRKDRASRTEAEVPEPALAKLFDEC